MWRAELQQHALQSKGSHVLQIKTKHSDPNAPLTPPINLTTLKDEYVLNAFDQAHRNERVDDIESVVEDCKYEDFFRAVFEIEDIERSDDVEAMLREHFIYDEDFHSNWFSEWYVLQWRRAEDDAASRCVLVFPRVFMSQFTYHRAKHILHPPPLQQLPHMLLQYGNEVTMWYRKQRVGSVRALQAFFGGLQCFTLGIAQSQWLYDPSTRQAMWKAGGTGLSPSLVRVYDHLADETGLQLARSNCVWATTRNILWRHGRTILRFILLQGHRRFQNKTAAVVVDLTSGEVSAELTFFPGVVLANERVFAETAVDDEAAQQYTPMPTYDRRRRVIRELLKVAPQIQGVFGYVECDELYGRAFKGKRPTPVDFDNMLRVCTQHNYHVGGIKFREFSRGLNYCVLQLSAEPPPPVPEDGGGEEEEDGALPPFTEENKTRWVDSFVSEWWGAFFGFARFPSCDEEEEGVVQLRLASATIADADYVLLRMYLTHAQLKLMQQAARKFTRQTAGVVLEVQNWLPLHTNFNVSSPAIPLGEDHLAFAAQRGEMYLCEPVNASGLGLQTSLFDDARWPEAILRTAFDRVFREGGHEAAVASLDDLRLEYEETGVERSEQELVDEIYPDKWHFAERTDNLFIVRAGRLDSYIIHWQQMRAVGVSTAVTVYDNCMQTEYHICDAPPSTHNELTYAIPHLRTLCLPQQFTGAEKEGFVRSTGEAVIGSSGLVRMEQHQPGEVRLRHVRMPQNIAKELETAFEPQPPHLDVRVRYSCAGERFDVSKIDLNILPDAELKTNEALVTTLLRGDTGAGKTTAVLEMAKYWVQCGGIVLYVTPRTALCMQTFEKLREALDTQEMKERLAAAHVVAHWKIAGVVESGGAGHRVVMTTAHSLHRFVGDGKFVSPASPPLLMVVDEVATIFLEDLQSVNVLRPLPFEMALARILPKKVAQLILIDANLPAVLVANVLHRISHSLHYYFQLRDAAAAGAVEQRRQVLIDCHEAVYSMVREQVRSATAFVERHGASSLRYAIMDRLRVGRRVAVFVSSLKTLKMLKELFAPLIPDAAQHIMEISSEKRPTDWSTVAADIRRADVRLLLYTTAASSGLDISFEHAIQYFEVVALVGTALGHLSLLQLYQAASRVRNAQELLFDCDQLLEPFSLAQTSDWKCIHGESVESVVSTFVAQKGRVGRHIADVHAGLGPDIRWLLGGNRHSSSALHPYSSLPFANSYAMGSYYRFLGKTRSTFLCALLMRVGYDVRVKYPVALDADDLRARQLAADKAFVKAEMRRNLQPDVSDEKWRAANEVRKGLGLPRLFKDGRPPPQENRDFVAVGDGDVDAMPPPPPPPLNEHWETVESTYIPLLEDYLASISQRSPQLFYSLDVWKYLIQERAHEADAVTWRAVLKRVCDAHFNDVELRRESERLEEQSERIMPVSSAALDLIVTSDGRAGIVLNGLLLFCSAVATTDAGDVLPASLTSVSREEPLRLPSIRSLIDRRSSLVLLDGSQWLSEMDALRKDSECVLYRRRTLTQKGPWRHYTAFASDILLFEMSGGSKAGVDFFHSEREWLRELWSAWTPVKLGQQRLVNNVPFECDFLHLCCTELLAALGDNTTLDDAMHREYAFDSNKIAKKKRKI